MPDATSLPFPSRSTGPTEATLAFYEALRSRSYGSTLQPSSPPVSSPHTTLTNNGAQGSLEPIIPAEHSEDQNHSEPNEYLDDGFDELRNWCEEKRTCWPNSLVEFLSYCEFMFAKDLGDRTIGRGTRTRRDYSWVPSVLCDIFHSTLRPGPMLHILEYFLSLLSVMILSDSTTVKDHAIIYQDILLRTVAPAQDPLSHEPDYLGALNPPDVPAPSAYGLKPAEVELLATIRRELYLHLLEPR